MPPRAGGPAGRPPTGGGGARRDRHGRGLRGPLTPSSLPLYRTRSQRFDDLVDEAVERLERRWADKLARVEFAVAEVPLEEDWSGAGVDPAADPVPLARLFPAAADQPARIVVFRRPLEARAADPQEREALVHEVLVEQVAALLGLSPETVDPEYGEPGPDED